MSKISASRKVVCESCSCSYAVKNNLLTHVQSAHLHGPRRGTVQLACDLCGYSTGKKVLLGGHIAKVHQHEAGVKCDWCCQEMTTRLNLTLHLFNACPLKKVSSHELDWMAAELRFCVRCDNCSRQFASSKRNLVNHLIKTCKAAERLFPQNTTMACDICLKEITTGGRQMAKHHVKAHTLEAALLECDQCGRQFSTYRWIGRHITRLHLPLDMHSTHFQCDECHELWVHKESLQFHLQSTCSAGPRLTNRELATCDMCGTKTSNRGNLSVHFKYVHLKQLDMYCDVCSRRFMQGGWARLTQHFFKGHNRLLDSDHLQCDQCGKRLANREYLSFHFSSVCPVDNNLLEKEWLNCDSCDYKTPRKSAFNAHIRCVHLKLRKLLQSDLCQLASVYKPNLAKHLLSIHKNG